MSYLYITDNGSVITLEQNRIVVDCKAGNKRSIPIETLESIAIFGKVQITTQAAIACMKKGITVTYYSKGGTYFGRLQSTSHTNAQRQRQQDRLGSTEFAIELSKRLIDAKIHNQIVVLRRYARTTGADVKDEINAMKVIKERLARSTTTEEIMGCEGFAARNYFSALSKMVESEFSFKGRSKRPPKDAFNSMLSLGYTILLYEIYGRIESKGLNPYFGFLHKDREQHPTLASDLMEEWRTVIVDSMVMSLVNGHEIFPKHFELDEDTPGVYLTKEGMKIFLRKMENKMQTSVKYLEYVDYSVSFRRGMDLQLNKLVQAIESEDASIYKPVYIR